MSAPTLRLCSVLTWGAGKTKLLTPEEAFSYLKSGATFTDNVEHFAKGHGGEVYIYKSKSKIKLSDWSKAVRLGI